MSNNLKGNPWVLDTEDAATIVHPGPAFVVGIQWWGYGNENDQCVITDGKRNVDILNWKGNPDIQPVNTTGGERFIVTDLIVRVLSAGKITVYLR